MCFIERALLPRNVPGLIFAQDIDLQKETRGKLEHRYAIDDREDDASM